MNFLEKDLEQIIYDAEKELLADKGLIIEGQLKRQFKIGNYGIADLIEFKKPYYCLYFKKCVKGEITIYELKKEKIGISAFLQSLKYAKGIQTYLQKHKRNIDFTINIILCGKNVDTSGEFIFIPSLISSFETFGYINNINFYTYDYLIDGINFVDHTEYNLKNKGF